MSNENCKGLHESNKNTNSGGLFNSDGNEISRGLSNSHDNKFSYGLHRSNNNKNSNGLAYSNNNKNSNGLAWSEKNKDALPRNEFKSSGKNVWFDCDKCKHTFYSSLSNVVNGAWCPYCVNKTESKLYDTIKEMYPSTICQFKQEWCKNKRHLPFDFCIPEYKIIIELDGRQHFEQVPKWRTPEEEFENDKYKEDCANDNGYSVIRIVQKDVFNDTYDWKKYLYGSIEEIKNSNEIANVYLYKNDEYDAF